MIVRSHRLSSIRLLAVCEGSGKIHVILAWGCMQDETNRRTASYSTLLPPFNIHSQLSQCTCIRFTSFFATHLPNYSQYAWYCTVVPAITPKILAAAAVGVIAKLVEDGTFGNDSDPDVLQFSFAPFTALGVAISLFLGFHNNSSYARWWEARIHWGAQIIAVRNLIRFLLGSIGIDNDDDILLEGAVVATEAPSPSSPGWRQDIIRLSMAQTHAFRAQMRPYCRMDGLVQAQQDRDRFLTDKERLLVTKSKNPANAILHLAGTILGRAHRQGDIDSYSMVQAGKLIDRLCDIQTACERIHNTSLPLAYSLLVHRSVTVYVLLAPFAIVESMGWWTPVFVAILAYTFFGLDELSRQIQEPFRDEPQCLALSAMCRTIEIDVYEALKHMPVPAKLEPIKSVLM